MTVTLELNANEARILQEIARSAGVGVEAVLHGLIAQVSPPEREVPSASTRPDAPEAFDPEALAEQKREQEEIDLLRNC